VLKHLLCWSTIIPDLFTWPRLTISQVLDLLIQNFFNQMVMVHRQAFTLLVNIVLHQRAIVHVLTVYQHISQLIIHHQRVLKLIWLRIRRFPHSCFRMWIATFDDLICLNDHIHHLILFNKCNLLWLTIIVIYFNLLFEALCSLLYQFLLLLIDRPFLLCVHSHIKGVLCSTVISFQSIY